MVCLLDVQRALVRCVGVGLFSSRRRAWRSGSLLAAWSLSWFCRSLAEGPCSAVPGCSAGKRYPPCCEYTLSEGRGATNVCIVPSPGTVERKCLQTPPVQPLSLGPQRCAGFEGAVAGEAIFVPEPSGSIGTARRGGGGPSTETSKRAVLGGGFRAGLQAMGPMAWSRIGRPVAMGNGGQKKGACEEVSVGPREPLGHKGSREVP